MGYERSQKQSYLFELIAFVYTVCFQLLNQFCFKRFVERILLQTLKMLKSIITLGLLTFIVCSENYNNQCGNQNSGIDVAFVGLGKYSKFI